ncbi:MAG: hypothetical protein JWL77_2089 [Chthonomonadaceae bacterium]|nr:hypothetical protein [Chthonomonadaceae bacterium]
MNRMPPENLPETPSAHRAVGCRGGLFQANLKAYLDGEISAIRGWLVRGHLAQCAECREELRWLRRLGEDMKELESTRPRPELRARILASLPATPPAPGIRVVHSRPDRERSPQFMPRLALAGVLAMLLAFSGVFALKHSSDAAVSGGKDSVASALPNVQHAAIAQDAADNPKTAPDALAMVTYTPEDDPYNAIADQRFRDQMAAIEREKSLLGQDDWHRLMAQARAVARKTDPATRTEMGIALAVPNIDAVRAHLPTWAKQEGAEMVATGQPNPVATDRTGLPSLRDEDPRANMIAFYVPARRGPAFLGALKQLGQISALPLTSRPLLSSSLKTESQVQPELTSDNVRKAVPAAPVAAESGALTEKTMAVHEKHNNAERYLVLNVLLTATHN